MMTEFAGVIEIEPPLNHREIARLRRLGAAGRPEFTPWTATRDGTLLRARRHCEIAVAESSLRALIASVRGPSRFRGTVAAYDPEAGELVALTVANGRVTIRSLRKGRGGVVRSNVIDLAQRRGPSSRAIS